MFNNRFNSSKNDPLVEAVKAARADGDARRLAESMANDLFGVFSRKAVVREYLSDYDYALEEAYKCVKEEDKMADKDYDRDGKIETSKKEVWGSRLRAAKASGKYKGPVDEKKDCYEESDGLPPSDAAKQAGAAQQSQTPSSTPKRTGNAAGSTAHEAQAMKESVLASLFEKYSFKAAQDSGKSVNEVAVGMPPQINPPAIYGSMKAGAQKATQAAGRIGARFAPTGFRQAAMSAAPTSVTSSGLKGMADTAGKAVSAASRAPGVVGRVAGLAARAGGPIGMAAGIGAAASMGAKSLATNTETGRAIGKSIGQTIRSVERPVSSLPTSKPQTAADVTANKQTAAANLKATGSKFAAGKPHSVTTFAPTAPGAQAKVQSRTTEKGWNDPGAYENRAKSATGTMQQIRQGKILPPSTQTGRPDDEASTQKFLNKELGRSTPNAQGPEAPAATPSKPVPTPPSRPTFSSDLPKIDTGPKPGPASVPNPKVDAPTPPSRPADLGSKAPTQNPDQERTKIKPMSESVVAVNGNRYRIV